MGAIHHWLYQQYAAGPGQAAFNDITPLPHFPHFPADNRWRIALSTNNWATPKYYPAKAGWDACTGLGSPRGDALVGVLANMPPNP